MDEIDGRLVGGLVVLAAIANARTFGRAAERLGMTQSGVSKAIAKLEARLGARLVLGIEHHVRSGALVELFPDWSDERFPLYVYYPSRSHVPAKVRKFIDFILDSLSTATNAPRAVQIRVRGEGREWRATG